MQMSINDGLSWIIKEKNSKGFSGMEIYEQSFLIKTLE